MISVNVKNLVKSFGGVVALDHVSLEIEAGELFFLLGPSGCGKTTFLRSLAGFYTPDSGKIFFGERDVTRLEPHKRKTGMMFQSYALWPHMTVAQNVAFGLEQQKVSRDEITRRVQEALETVQMGAYAERKPNQLSGGQQQRIALARALVVRPRCLLLDEPLSNLDARLRFEMRNEIRRVCKEYELTTIYVTHDQKEALSIADRLAVFNAGKILQVGTPIEVYKRPNSRFVASFIGVTNFVEGTLMNVGGGEGLVNTAIGPFNGVLADPAHPPKEGDTVWLSIRPECIRLEKNPIEGNCFRGDIGKAVYYGELAHYKIQSQGLSLKASELNPSHLSRSEQHDLFAWVDSDDVVILSH